MGNSESRAEFTKELAKVNHFEQVDDYHRLSMYSQLGRYPMDHYGNAQYEE